VADLCSKASLRGPGSGTSTAATAKDEFVADVTNVLAGYS